MLRNILLFSIAITFSNTIAAQSKKQIKELKIKSATENITIYKDGKETVTYKSDYSIFDKDGNSVSEIEYNQDGTIKKKQTTTYVGKDKTQEITEHPNDVDNDNSPPKKYKKTTWKYNSNGDKTEEVEYDGSGAIVKKTTYAYDSNGNKAFEMEYDSAGKMTQKSAYSYDLKGLKTEKKVYGPGDVLLKYIKYTYTY
ncbi:MAG: hypothetical protein NT084_02255 [Bacteroidetes bacterium]|nr:hypothetical protein [Bacteroidota bacterium]